MTPSYPRFTVSPENHVHIPDARHADDSPFGALPDDISLPLLPLPTRAHEFVSGYAVTTHIIPAVYSRYTPRGYKPHSDDPPADAAARKAWATSTKDALFAARRETRNAQGGPLLWNVINRYARIGPPRSKQTIGITVVVTHANGFHKEVSGGS